MKRLKLIFGVTGILLVIGSGSYFLGFGGTRFTEKLWAVGTEEDYLVFPENRENILYQSCNDYYLKCEKRTYRRTPVYWYIWIRLKPCKAFPNRYTLVKKHPGTVIVKISEAQFREATKNEDPIFPQTLMKGCRIVPAIPPEAKVILGSAGNFFEGDLIDDMRYLDTVVLGVKIADRKSAASYCLLPLMLPTLCIDAATTICWPLNIIWCAGAGYCEAIYRDRNPVSDHCACEKGLVPR